MSIQQLTIIEEQFTRHLQTIRIASKQLPKNIILRVSAWLKKLCSVVDNYFWRKNRNLYAEVLAIMLQQGKFQAPFDRYPPQGSLPKLTLYEIPFYIREQLQANKNKHHDLQNQGPIHNKPANLRIDLNSHQKLDTDNLRLKKKHSLQLKSLKSINDMVDNQHLYSQQNLFHEYHIQTERKNNDKIIATNVKIDKLTNTIEEVLKFLAKNNEVFMENQQYVKILKQMIQYGDQEGKDFRQLKFSCIQN